jgi:predicted nucleic acid-binding Zn ribbon protein
VRRRAPRPVSLALEGFTATLAPASVLGRAQACWTEVVGEAIAAAAQPVAERDGVLTVRCEAAVWAQELDLMASELLARLNAALGGEGVRRLRCLTG